MFKCEWETLCTKRSHMLADPGKHNNLSSKRYKQNSMN